MLDLSQLIMPPEKVAARRKSIGASDMPVIMGDDDARKLKLWEFKRGAEQDDLSGVLPVMLGYYSEAFTLAWFAKVSGLDVRPNKETKRKGIMTATPDAFIGGSVVDAKHVGTFKSDDDIAAYYVPQLFAQMHTCGSDGAYLAVLKGNADFFYMEYAWDEGYGAAVVAAAEAFWQHCQDGIPAPLPVPPPPKPVGVREVSMQDSNAWAIHASTYRETMLAADRHEIAKKEIKALVPDDASKAFGHGLVVKRDKRGALRFSVEE